MKIKYLKLLFILLFITGCASNLNNPVKEPEPYRVIITTGLDSGNDPINDLEELSINEKKVYIYTKWNLPAGKVMYRCVIKDGKDKVVHDRYTKMHPKQNNWNFWSYQKIDKRVDSPGVWKFEIYLDGIKYVEKTATVYEETETLTEEADTTGSTLKKN